MGEIPDWGNLKGIGHRHSLRFWVAQRGSLGLRFGGDGAQGWGEAAPRGVGAHESA